LREAHSDGNSDDAANARQRNAGSAVNAVNIGTATAPSTEVGVAGAMFSALTALSAFQ
jgi:hypothetical protein